MGVDQGREGGQEGVRVRAEQHHGRVPGHPAADAGDRQVHAGQPARQGRHLRLRARRDEEQMAQAERRRVAVTRIPPNQYCTYFNRVREPSPGEQSMQCTLHDFFIS